MNRRLLIILCLMAAVLFAGCGVEFVVEPPPGAAEAPVDVPDEAPFDNGFEADAFPAIEDPDSAESSAPVEVTLAADGFGVVELPAGEPAEVVEVIDGDTVRVRYDGREQSLRYIGIDTPERDEPYYAEATAANSQLVEGQTVILVRDVSDRDDFGRLLRYVYLEDGTFVNAELIRQGYGRLVTFPPDVAEADNFRALQQEARNSSRGLWGVSELLGAPSGCVTCAKNAYNCTDFTSQAEAQACFDYCIAQTGEDVHRLDGGGDGVVCESLP